MTGSLSWITDDSWPSDEGWPYPDADAGRGSVEEPADPTAWPDDERLSLLVASAHLLDNLDPVERTVITLRFGLDGHPARTMREIQHELGLPRAELRFALGGGLTKLRRRID